MIAFLGMGLLGSNFVKALLKRGEHVNVWNRTAEKAAALQAQGAKAFADVAEAVKGAARIHVTLKDDASVDEVLEKASAGFGPDVIIVDHTTTTAKGAEERTRRWKEMGVTYLHAPVFMGPINALESTGTILVSGDQELIAKVEPALSQMTGKVLNFGTTLNKAAGMKLIGNLFLIAFTGGIADTLTLAKALGITTAEVTSLFDTWNPGAMMPARLKRMTSGMFTEPSWELAMARKDAGLMIQEAEQNGMRLTSIPAIAERMDALIADGFGQHDWTVLAKDAQQ